MDFEQYLNYIILNNEKYTRYSVFKKVICEIEQNI